MKITENAIVVDDIKELVEVVEKCNCDGECIDCKYFNICCKVCRYWKFLDYTADLPTALRKKVEKGGLV